MHLSVGFCYSDQTESGVIGHYTFIKIYRGVDNWTLQSGCFRSWRYSALGVEQTVKLLNCDIDTFG